MKPVLALLPLTLAAALALPASPAYSQIELSEAEPPDGARLDAPPAVLGESGAPEPSQSPAQGVDAETEEGDDDDGPDILLITLITVAVFGGAAVRTSLLYLVRRSVGFEPHRPPEGDESGGEEH